MSNVTTEITVNKTNVSWSSILVDTTKLLYFVLRAFPLFVIDIFTFPWDEPEIKIIEMAAETAAEPKRPEASFYEETNPYTWNPGDAQVRIEDKQIDDLIRDYEILRINIVKYILVNRELIDIEFVKKRFRSLQRLYHPDRPGGSVEKSTEVNVAFDNIKTLMASEEAQFLMIKKVFLFYHPPEPGNGYVFLFIFGFLLVFVVAMRK